MEIQLFEYHPIIGYHFIPGLRTRIEHEGGGYLVRVNSTGFRSEHEYVKEKTAGKFRILLFGDSFTAAEAVSNKHRYGDVLETLIPNAEVYNFALPGTGTDQHYLIWREIAREFEHDLVIIAAQVENIRRIVVRRRLAWLSTGEEVWIAKPYFELGSDGGLVLNNIPVPKEPLKFEDLPENEKESVDLGGRLPWLRQIVNKMGAPVKDLAQKLSGYQPLPEYDDPNGKEWLLMRAIFRLWVSEIEKPVVIMPLPLYHYVEETASPAGFRARFKELAVMPNTTVHDPMDEYAVVPRSERRSLRFQNDLHPTPAHHRLLAESLAKTVRKFIPAKVEGAFAE